MKNYFALSFLLLFLFTGNVKGQKVDYQIVPLPKEIKEGTTGNTPFVLMQSTRIVYPKHNKQMQRNAEFLSEYVKDVTGYSLKIGTRKIKSPAISLTLGLQSSNPEAYSINISEAGIQIQGASEAGVFYGIQALRKSMPIGKYAQIEFPSVEINDYPEFGYRGALLDISRHFFTKEEVKEYIDMMALHNMNRFHWHLTDDQGWRIEIKKYPELTSIGSQRKESQNGYYENHERILKFDGIPHGGFFTQDDIKEVVAYAAERYITIIPEIDLPGHMVSALASYPELGCTGGPYNVWTHWGISEDVLCAGNEKTYQFLTDVFDEIMELFPSTYIHIGGDECPKTRWAQCPKCQAKIKAEGIKSDDKHTKEEYLQSYVMKYMSDYLSEHGRKIIGWDEILEGEAAPGATIMSWRGEAGGIEAARLGHDVIMVPNNYLYLDYYQSKDYESEPYYAIGGYNPVDKIYNYNPLPASLNETEKAHIIGVQANLWTEYIKDFKQVEYMILPRWGAVAEIQWTGGAKDYPAFLKRLDKFVKLYQAKGYTYAKHAFQ
ncbi:MAG TPA: beta-N-acetylhexosaminidase [Candidatus Phocaeicola gallistercoris]|nr:beta-N-acetylhexosaminidase [Candidatus Phocaeicola gallistercoris]